MLGRTIATAVTALALLGAGGAQASTGPLVLQAGAVAQTKLLFAHLEGPQTASPARCDEGQPRGGFLGVYLLPTLSFGSGDAAFSCRIRAHLALLDLGGAIASEDANPDSTYTTADGEVLRFTPPNLERICDDLVRVYPPAAAPATVDGRAITGARVSTPVFHVRVLPGAGQYADSVALGHPGRLAAAYCGIKALVPLRRGRHVIAVDLSDIAGAPTHFSYDIHVRR